MAGNGRKVNCIAAMARNRGIGKDGMLPWNLKSEMKYFTRITSTVKNKGNQNAVIMGRKTWESIPARYRPLPGRLNVILSQTMSAVPEGVLICSSLQDAMNVLSKPPYDNSIEEIFVTGGYTSYKEAVMSPMIHRIYLTQIHLDIDCNTFFPEFDENQFSIISDPNVPTETQEEKGITFQYLVYQKKDEK